MKKYLVKTISVFVFAALFSCEGIFILDPIDPRLPKYTHTGNDVAGAFIDGVQWKSVVSWSILYTFNAPEFTIYPADDILKISFYGNIGAETYSLEFTLAGFEIHTYEDLIKLKGRKIQLDGELNYGVIDGYGDSCFPRNAGAGQFYAKDISTKENGVLVFSGTFGFVTPDASCPSAEVAYGRFDYTVNARDFTIIPE